MKRLVSLLVSSLVLLPALVCAQPSYSITDLGTLGVDNVSAYGVNDAGQVVGRAYTSGSSAHAFIWQSGTMTDLGTLSSPTSDFSIAYGINNAGEVVGTSYDSGGHIRPCTWTSGVISQIAVGTGSGTAYAINDGSAVVGTGPSSLYGSYPFEFSGSTVTDLTGYGMTYGEIPSAINVSGAIAGTGVGSHSYPLLWQGGTDYNLGTLGGHSGQAYGINSLGQVVGEADVTGSATYHAFLWQPTYPNATTGTMLDLGLLGTGDTSTALAINAWGIAVGTSNSTLGGTPHAFVYQWGTMYDLNSCIPGGSGWTLVVANAINNLSKEQIVGVGYHSGLLHSFILTRN